MKKILVLMVAVFAMTMTAQAQLPTDKGRLKALYDFSSKFKLVSKPASGKTYAVMNYPVTYYNYYGVMGVKKNGRGVSINDVMMMTRSEQENFAKAINKMDPKLDVRVASGNDLQQALNKKINIQSEGGPYNFTTKGFYIAMTEASYKRMQELRKQYRNGTRTTRPNSRTNGTTNSGNPDVFNSVDNSSSSAFTVDQITVSPSRKKK